MGMSLGQPNQIKFIFLVFAKAPLRITPCPNLSLRNVFETRNPRSNTQDFALYGSGDEWLVSRVGRELDAKIASRRSRIHGMRVFLDLEPVLLKIGG